ncbi:MAG: hypothetical protein BGO81_00460 [Devosia sp. 66-22]|nr:MAG: hypothetical protein BGO81_00460 [Devosia sp. 66-22]
MDHFALAADVRRSEELALIAAAMRDAIPNPGDAFAINLQLASNGGAVAAALGVGLALGGDARFNFNVGRSLGQTIVAGGLNLSF